MIDPQGQAIKWIKSMETQHVRVLSSDITKLCCGMYPNRVFNCLHFGPLIVPAPDRLGFMFRIWFLLRASKLSICNKATT